jgi:hypothetical protein
MYLSFAGVLDRPGVTPIGRSVFSDKAAARSSVGVLREWGGERIVTAHGMPWTGDVRAALADAFAWLG